MKTKTGPKVTALAPWFGSNRLLAPHVGRLLAGCRWVGVPFGGGMCELAHIDATTVVVSDLHRWIINVAQVAAGPDRERLISQLESKLFHPDELDAAQERMKEREKIPFETGMFDAAVDYFVCVWMGRSSIAGTVDEFHGRLSTRWNANGGDSNVRYRSAVEGLKAWELIARRCSFSVLDVFEFLARALKEDQDGHGLYLDPPFPTAGLIYKFNSGKDEVDWHRRLAHAVWQFRRVRVVMRFYDHPLVRRFYPESGWEYHQLTGKKQSNDDAPELLLASRADRPVEPPEVLHTNEVTPGLFSLSFGDLT